MKHGFLRSFIGIFLSLILLAAVDMFVFSLTAHSDLDNAEQVGYSYFLERMENRDWDTVYCSNASVKVYVETEEGFKYIYNPRDSVFEELLAEKGVTVLDAKGLEDSSYLNTIIRIGVIAFNVSVILVMLFVISAIKSESKPDAFIVITPNTGGVNNTDLQEQSTTDFKLGDSDKKTFDDVAGLKEVKEDVKVLVDFLVNKDKYAEAGAKLPKGVIFYGPPGTGKTLLAKAISGEAGVPFHYMSGSDFVELYVGVGAKRVRELFDKARKDAPCIIFIDEIDAIGRSRDSRDSNGEDRKTINALLAEMDGFKETENIIVIGATNRLKDLDPALLRSGRFTNKYCVPLPQTPAERKEVLNLYMWDKSFGDDVNVDDLAHEVSGLSPAQIEAWLNEAAIIQVQQSKAYITKVILDDALSKMLLQGHVRKDQSFRSEEERKIVAYHEAGHAILGRLLGSDVTKVTILSTTSGAGGVTFTTPKESGLLSVTDIKNKVMELYGGRLAETILYNGDFSKVTTGASNDIERATELIRAMVVSYGMSEEFGLINLEKVNADKEFIINQEVAIAKELQEAAMKLLTDNVESLEQLVSLLLEKDTVYKSELLELPLKTLAS